MRYRDAMRIRAPNIDSSCGYACNGEPCPDSLAEEGIILKYCRISRCFFAFVQFFNETREPLVFIGTGGDTSALFVHTKMATSNATGRQTLVADANKEEWWTFEPEDMYTATQCPVW